MSRRRVRRMYRIPCRLQSHRYITYIHRCIWISQISSHPSTHGSPPKQIPPTRSSCTLFPGRSQSPTRLHHGSSSFSTLRGAHSGAHSGAPPPWCSSKSTLASFPVQAMVPVLLFYSPGPQQPTAGRQACVSVLTPSPDGLAGRIGTTQYSVSCRRFQLTNLTNDSLRPRRNAMGDVRHPMIQLNPRPSALPVRPNSLRLIHSLASRLVSIATTISAAPRSGHPSVLVLRRPPFFVHLSAPLSLNPRGRLDLQFVRGCALGSP